MVVYQQPPARDMDQVFRALSDGTRRDILARVMDADASVSELAAQYAMSFAAVQKHVAVLERVRLVTKRRDGRAQRVTGNPDTVRRAHELLTQFEVIWQARVRGLDQLLAPAHEGDPNAGDGDSHRDDRRDERVPGATEPALSDLHAWIRRRFAPGHRADDAHAAPGATLIDQ